MLRLYNVTADRGGEKSRIYQGGGLVYRILDEQGKHVGVPIKASDFYNKPTLKYLEAKYARNEVKRLPQKARVRNAVDMTLLNRKATSLQELTSALEKQGISTVLKQNDTGLIYGITYVDHKTGSVFNGSTLGKQYSAKALQERCLPERISEQDLLSLHPALKPSIGLHPQHTAAETRIAENARPPMSFPVVIGNPMDALIKPEPASDYVPNQLKRRRKKKKKRNLGNNV